MAKKQKFAGNKKQLRNKFMKDIKDLLDQFVEGQGKNKGRKADERYASFDFCYNYFYSFYKEKRLSELKDDKNLQASCLQIGFYLASWGMMRGSAFLLEKSVRHYKNLIIAISEMSTKLWKIDVNEYDEKNINLLLDCKEEIIDALGRSNAKTWDTLSSKIMLGVFANVPAYDQYFKKFLSNLNKMGETAKNENGKEEKYCQTFNKTSLYQLKEFYEKNGDIFDSYEIHTFNFLTAEKTNIVYTKAKLVDMCGFMGGQ